MSSGTGQGVAWVLSITNNDDDPDYEIIREINILTTDRVFQKAVEDYINYNPDKLFKKPSALVMDETRPLRLSDGSLAWNWYDPHSNTHWRFCAKAINVYTQKKGKNRVHTYQTIP